MVEHAMSEQVIKPIKSEADDLSKIDTESKIGAFTPLKEFGREALLDKIRGFFTSKEPAVDDTPPIKLDKTVPRRSVLKGALALLGGATVGGSAAGCAPESSPSGPDVKEPSKKKIVENEVLGLDKPLSQEEFEVMLQESNRAYQAGEVETDPQSFYGTFIITDKAARKHQADHGESIVDYYNEHVAAMNKLLQQAEGLEMNRFKMRRLVIVEDQADIRFYNRPLEERIADSSGYEVIKEDTGLTETVYEGTSEASKIDMGRLHEWGHQILHLPDMYSLDVDPATLLDEQSQAIVGAIPEAYRTYSADTLFGKSLMHVPTPVMDSYSINMIQRRYEQDLGHDKRTVQRDLDDGWPTEFPKSAEIVLGRFEGASFRIYRTNTAEDAQSYADQYRETRLVEAFAGQVNNGTLSLPDIAGLFPTIKSFDKPVVPNGKATLLVVIETPNGPATRWLDVRLFNNAYWDGHKDKATMALNMVEPYESRPPEEFDWSVTVK